MSNAAPGDADDSHKITLEDDGIYIEKVLAPDEFDTPAIVFTIRSERDKAAYIRITDPLPEAIDPDDVGLHPEYDSEGWRRRGGDLQFEGRLDPGAQIETVYGLRVAEIDRPSALLAEPRIDQLVDADTLEGGGAEAGDDGSAGADADADDEGDQAADDEVEDAVPDEAGPEDDAGDESEPEPEPAAGDDGADPGAEPADRAGGRDGGPGRAAAATAGTEGAVRATDVDVDVPEVPATLEGEASVAEALAAELERGGVPSETLDTLNQHLEAELTGSSRTRLDQVQARLSDLEAYTEALETILDRVGTDEDIVESVKDLRRNLSELDNRTDDLADDLDQTRRDLNETAQSLEALSGVVDDLDEETTAELEAVRSEMDDELADLRADLDDRTDTLRSEVDDRTDTLEAELTEQLDAVREDVSELQEWRENLVSSMAMGGGGGGDDD